MATIEITLGLLDQYVGKVPLANAQSIALAEFKAAGNDLAALATKAGASIAFLGRKEMCKEMGSLLDLVLGHPNSSLSQQGLCW